jgi:hypothetical protein
VAAVVGAPPGVTFSVLEVEPVAPPPRTKGDR